MTALKFGSLDLMGGGAIQLEALGTDSGTDWGNPGSIETQLDSYLQYGTLVSSEGYENRTVMVAVSVQGTGPVRAAAEAALTGEIRKRNVLLYTPPGSTVVTRFEVLTSSFDQVPNDLLEVANGERIYMLRLVCLPFAFSSAEVITAPFTPPTTVTTTVVDDGSSTSGWSTYDDPNATETLTSSGGVIISSSTAIFQGFPTLVSPFICGAKRTGSTSLSGTPYVAIDVSPVAKTNWAYRNLRVVIDSVDQAPVSVVPLPNGFTRFWLAPGTPTFSTIGAYIDVYPAGTGSVSTDSPASEMRVDQILKSNSYTAVSTNKQLQRVLTIGGSAPTVGSFAVEHETSSLGDVLVYTNPAPYIPAMRTFRTSGPSTVTDSTAVSGSYESLTAPVVYSRPYSSVPDGEYLVMARVQTATTATITCTAETISGTTSMQAQSVSLSLGTFSSWALIRLGVMHLPLMTAGAATSLRFTVSKTGGTVFLDELYLFNMETGQLSEFNCGTGAPGPGGSANRLWIDSPSVQNNGEGQYQRGFASDRSDAVSAYSISPSPSVHEFPPGQVMAFTVTSNADSAKISFQHRRAWMHTAAS